MNKFHLMHKNDIVGTVTIQKDEYNKGYLHIENIIDSTILPIGTRDKEEDIDKQVTAWNDSRSIPLGRPNYLDFLNDIGANNNSELIPYCFMCSLTDCYWFKPDNSDIKWEDVNFYQNGFSSNLYKRLFFNDKNEPINNLNSPDITCDGALPKMWQEENGHFVLIKGKTSGFPMDACYEVIADFIFGEIQAEHVYYELREIDNQIYSACECFIHSDDEEFVPIENLMSDCRCYSQADFLPILVELGFKEAIDKMILGDAILGNIDRHARNYGVIIDSNTQQIKRFAPLFDHNICALINNHGMLTYQPTKQSFNKTLPMLGTETLTLAKNIDMNTLNALVRSLPIEPNLQDRMFNQLQSRISKISELVKEKEYEFERK